MKILECKLAWVLLATVDKFDKVVNLLSVHRGVMNNLGKFKVLP